MYLYLIIYRYIGGATTYRYHTTASSVSQARLKFQSYGTKTEILSIEKDR